MPFSRLTTGMFVAALVAVCGCRARGDVEVLEGRLRVQEDQLRTLHGRLEQVEQERLVATREADALRTQLAQEGRSPLPAEQSQALFRVEKLAFQDLLTGGLDRDGRPGDDELNVVLVPQDKQGGTVKLPGRLKVVCFEIGAASERRALAEWEFAPEDLRDRWTSGLFGGGFHLQLAWPEKPRQPNLLLVATLDTADGRHFEANRTLAVVVDPTVAGTAPGANPLPGALPLPADPARSAGNAKPASYVSGATNAPAEPGDFFDAEFRPTRSPASGPAPAAENTPRQLPRGGSPAPAPPAEEDPFFTPFAPR